MEAGAGALVMENVGEALARIEGKIDIINERQTRSNDDIQDLRKRANTHSDRIGALEGARQLQTGEKLGSDRVFKTMLGLAGVCGLSGIAAAAKILLGH